MLYCSISARRTKENVEKAHAELVVAAEPEIMALGILVIAVLLGRDVENIDPKTPKLPNVAEV